jgi:hypothetical protein
MAKMLGIKKRQEVAKVIQTLVSLGAVDIEVVNHTRGRRNVYVVHEAPPEGYAGPASRKDYYANQAEAPSSGGVVPPEGTTPERGTTESPPQGDENQLKGKLGSKSFSRDKSLEIYTHARDEDRPDVEARGKPDDDAEVLGVHEQDLFGGDQLPVSNSKIKKPAQRDAEFDAFWRIYPKRVGKIDARRAWDKALTRVELGRLMAGAETYARYVQADPWRKQFTKDPATWLNKGCWDDELDFSESRNGHRKPTPPRSTTDERVAQVGATFAAFRARGGHLGLPGGQL